MSQADSNLETAFEAACQFVGLATTNKSLSVTDDQLLRFYGLYKQATAGACDAAKPSFFDRRGRAKWRAWHSCKCLSSSQAQQQYVHLLTELHPGWSDPPSSSDTTKQKQGGVGGPVQSRMADAQEEDEEPDAAPPLLRAARCGDAAAVGRMLQHGADPNQRGNDGETALHWAADRGQLQVLRMLLDHGADINAIDGDGMAALHYAALAEQEAAARLLGAEPGAKLDLRSTDGETAAAMAPAGWGLFTNKQEA
ncbi:Acyl-CoA-binding domain-containing protein 4 [Chlorella vulgaris]